MVEYLTCTEEIRVRFAAGPFLLKWNRNHIHFNSEGVRPKVAYLVEIYSMKQVGRQAEILYSISKSHFSLILKIRL